MIKISKNTNSGLACFVVEGIEKNERNERIMTNAIVTMYDYLMFSKKTLNNWKHSNLVIRYARNYEEFKMLEDAINQDKQLPKDHEEKSLISY